MSQKPKHPGNQMDPGKRLVQLALKEAMCSKLSVISSFKREFDKKKKDKWKNKRDNCQAQVLKASLASPELTEIMTKIEEHKTNIIAIEKEIPSEYKVPKGRGRGKPLSNHSKPSGAFDNSSGYDIHRSEMQGCSIRVPTIKGETIDKIDEPKASLKVIKRKMSSKDDKVPKGRGRGRSKPPPNQFRTFTALGAQCETFIEPTTRLCHQFSSSCENNIPTSFTPLCSRTMATAASKANTALHLSHLDLLDSSPIDKSHTINLSVSDDFSNLSLTKEIRQEKNWYAQLSSQTLSDQEYSSSSSSFLSDKKLSNLSLTKDVDQLFSSPSLSDQGYSSSSSLFLSDNKFPNLSLSKDVSWQKNENLCVDSKQLSPTSDYSSCSSLFISDNKISFKEKDDLFFPDQKFLHNDGDQKSLYFKDTIQAPKPNTHIKVCDRQQALPLLKMNEYNSSEEKENGFPNFSVSKNDSSDGLLPTLSNQYKSAVIHQSSFCNNDDSDFDIHTSLIKNANTFDRNCDKLEPEDNHIDELINSFINKPENKHIEPIKSVHLSADMSDTQYIDELIDSFIDKPDDEHINNSNDSFFDNSGDSYIDDLINSFVSKKTNDFNEKTNTEPNISKEVSLLDVPSNIFAIS